MASQFEHELNSMMESVRAKAHQTSFLLDEMTRIAGQVGMIMHQANEHAVDELSRLVNNLDNPHGHDPLADGHMPHVLRGEPAPPQQQPQRQARKMPPYAGPQYDNHPEYERHPNVHANGAAPPPLPDRG
jgi:hypothetical protein